MKIFNRLVGFQQGPPREPASALSWEPLAAAGWSSTPGFQSGAGLQALAQVVGKIHLGLREDLVDDSLWQPSLELKLEEFGHLVGDSPLYRRCRAWSHTGWVA